MSIPYTTPRGTTRVHHRSRVNISTLLAIAILSGCTIEPSDNTFFFIENHTHESVVLTWTSDQTGPTPKPFRTLRPGEADRSGLGEECRKSSSVTAVAPSGWTDTYGPPICRGTVWTIGSK